MQPLGKPDRNTGAHSQKLDGNPLRNVRRRKEREDGVRRAEVHHFRPHVYVGNQRPMPHQAHLRLACRAGGEIENGVVFRPHGGVQPRKQAGVFLHCSPAHRAQLLEIEDTFGLACQQHPLRGQLVRAAAHQRFEGLRSVHKNQPRRRRAQRLHEFRRRIAGVNRGRNAARRHNAEIGQIKLRARLRMKGNHIPSLDAEAVETGGDLLCLIAKLAPREDLVFPLSLFAHRLMQRRRIAVLAHGLFEQGKHSASNHRGNRSMPSPAGSFHFRPAANGGRRSTTIVSSCGFLRRPNTESGEELPRERASAVHGDGRRRGL